MLRTPTGLAHNFIRYDVATETRHRDAVLDARDHCRRMENLFGGQVVLSTGIDNQKVDLSNNKGNPT